MAFLTHPRHGATNVGSGEIPGLLAAGWKLDTHEAWLALNGKGPKPADPVRAKPGPKPKPKAD